MNILGVGGKRVKHTLKCSTSASHLGCPGSKYMKITLSWDIIWQIFTNVSDEYAASIFRVADHTLTKAFITPYRHELAICLDIITL
jgi:hypothetical protein